MQGGTMRITCARASPRVAAAMPRSRYLAERGRPPSKSASLWWLATKACLAGFLALGARFAADLTGRRADALRAAGRARALILRFAAVFAMAFLPACSPSIVVRRRTG